MLHGKRFKLLLETARCYGNPQGRTKTILKNKNNVELSMAHPRTASNIRYDTYSGGSTNTLRCVL